jgi:Arc/MetJ-type ribon-helix-helix transcriptional regulator
MNCMTHPVPTRFTDDELVLLDQLVADGAGENRSEVIRRGVHHLADTLRRDRAGAAIAASYRDRPQTRSDDAMAMANALAMTEAEPW